MELYLSLSGNVSGPYSLERIVQMLEQKEITPDIQAAVAGTEVWSPLKEVINIKGWNDPAPPSDYNPFSQTPAVGNKVLIKRARKKHYEAVIVVFLFALLFAVIGIASSLYQPKLGIGEEPNIPTYLKLLVWGFPVLFLFLGIGVALRNSACLWVVIVIYTLDLVVWSAFGILSILGSIGSSLWPFALLFALLLAVRVGFLKILIGGLEGIDLRKSLERTQKISQPGSVLH
ncbi:hypothetical protein [Haloferula sp.]|uniref:hypothetical protein n=1 Tax=Haloferula sp. TaxID=2497595 RepID=UPI00329DEB5B